MLGRHCFPIHALKSFKDSEFSIVPTLFNSVGDNGSFY